MAGVTFHGMDTRTTLVRWGLAAVAAGIVLGATVPIALRGLAVVWATDRQGLVWLFERVFGFTAYIAITASVVYGLLLSTRLLDHITHRPISYTLHQDLAAVGIGLAGIHGFLLGLDHTMPFSIAQILVPGLSPHAPLAVAVGQLAMYLALAVVGSFYLRPHLSQRAWRTLHYGTFLVFLGVTVHGIASGSDSSAAWAEWLYIGSSAVVGFLLAYRISLVLAVRAGRGPVSRAQGELERVHRR